MGGQEKDAEWTGAERRAAEVRLSEDTVRYLEARMTASVAKGMRDAMTEEAAAAFWMAGLNVLQKSASDHAGRFVIGGLWGLARKLATFMMLGGIVYAVGGWSALATIANSNYRAGEVTRSALAPLGKRFCARRGACVLPPCLACCPPLS